MHCKLNCSDLAASSYAERPLQLNKGLNFCFFPTKLHINNIRTEFERVYFELKRFFVTRNLAGFDAETHVSVRALCVHVLPYLSFRGQRELSTGLQLQQKDPSVTVA